MKKNESLAAVGFLATILVVMCHVDNSMPTSSQTTLVKYLGGWFTAADTANFFLLSGYYLAKRYGEVSWYVSALKKRIRTLLVPYVIWNLMSLLVVVLIGVIKNHCYILPTFKEPYFGLQSIFGLGWAELPYDLPLWYIKSLFYFLIVSFPFFYLIKRSVIWLVTMVGLAVAVFLLFPDFTHKLRYTFPVLQFAAFLIGAAFALGDWKIEVQRNKLMGCVALSLWLSMSYFAMISTGVVGRCLMVANIFGSIAALHFIVRSCSIRVPVWLASTSFFIYAGHWMLLSLLSRLPIAMPWPLFDYALRLVVVLLLLVVFARVVNKYSPRLYSVICGGRQ